MTSHVARGLPADWLNAWLAAIGVTVIVADARVSWSDDPVPRARFSIPSADLAAAVAEALPTAEAIEAMAFAGLKQSVTAEDYREAAQQARIAGDDTLSVLVTDLARDPARDTLAKGNFNVGVEGAQSLDRRVLACRKALPSGDALVDLVAGTFDGRVRRIKTNGLGFDYRRIAGPFRQEAEMTADPLIECLGFFGTLLLPVRGTGVTIQQRGWFARSNRRHAFRWPAWRPDLDRWAIDALLDLVYARQGGNGRDPALDAYLERLGVTAVYGSVPFAKVGDAVTVGYASERLA